MKGLQCPKALWLAKYQPELRTPPDSNRLALFQEGHEVGHWAQKLFPGGRHIDLEADTIPHRLKLTQDAIAAGEETLYEATFQYNSILVMVDILHCGPRGWELIEVKGSTGEKPVFHHDLALQAYVLQGAGLTIKNYFLAHLNPNYVRQDKLELHKLFTLVNLTTRVAELQHDILANIEIFRSVLKEADTPNIKIGPQCTQPYDCDFIHFCWKDVPTPSVFSLSGLQLDEKFNLYHRGITHLRDIPETLLRTDRQRKQLQSEKSNTQFLDRDGIQAFLKTLHYPLYFLDFEAFQLPIPLYKDTKPYQQVAFQYSVHLQSGPGAPIEHRCFLAMPGEDPRPQLAENLVKDIPTNACILTYNANYEKSVLKQLAYIFPKHADHLNQLHHQVLDLMPPFQAQHIYTRAMNGSFSIKSILPALVPELNYQHLHIQDGQGAARAYAKISQLTSDTERNSLKDHLLEYCKMDTLAMVKLVEYLNSIV